MGLETYDGNLTFVNISKGKLYTKKKGEDPVFFDSISGVITGVQFKMDEYEKKPYEKAELTIVDGDDKFVLAMRVDSGYFRGFCNAVKSGTPTEKVKISPFMKDEDGKTSTTCFVNQNGAAPKHYHTKDNVGGLPELKRVRVRGQDVWDGTEQIEYWKNWLKNIQWKHELIADAKQPIKTQQPVNNASSIVEPIDDLPF